jgi:hypothetical protein
MLHKGGHEEPQVVHETGLGQYKTNSHGTGFSIVWPLSLPKIMASSGVLRRVALVRTDVSEELRASLIRACVSC